jgi:hypothetical protein
MQNVSGMNFRTIINVEQSPLKISYSDKVMFVGSCFASYMGEQMQLGKMPVMINPAGTVYNPVSVLNTLENLISGKIISQDDLYCHEGTWLSFYHYTDFSSEDPGSLIKKINDTATGAREFLSGSRFLFITFGTARVYRWKKSGIIVSNCHKVPAAHFETELLSVNDIAESWKSLLGRLSEFNPALKVVFTISPVRHWKDGAHGNQVSKSVLFLALEELMKHQTRPGYFPAYELQMDDLRDYRFYSDDMLHPSSSAVDYIWGKFSSAYFENDTVYLRNDVLKITRACNHRFMTDSPMKKRAFAEKMLKQIAEMRKQNPIIDLAAETDYFLGLLEN